MEREMEAERDVREEGEVEERSAEREVEVERTTEKACKGEERCEEEDLESHSAGKRARFSAVFSDSQETAIVEFVKDHPELYGKENARFHDGHRKEALWSEIAEKLNLRSIDVKRWFESQRTRYGKLSKQQSGQAPESLPDDSLEFTNRWVSSSPTPEGKVPTEVWGSTQVPLDSMMSLEVQLQMGIV